ncbi:MAG: DNA-processing protein DprA, partial [Bacteroidota bacterium]
MNDDAFINRIAITMIEGVGDVIARQLISYCGGVEAVFREKKKHLLKIPDVGPKTAGSITGFKGFERAAKELEFVRKHGIRMLFYTDEAYPSRLKNCHDAPLLLFTKGEANLSGKRMIAVVGTRKATDYGKERTTEIVNQLGKMDIVVVSGLAFGIDIIAHKTCLESDVPTIGVVAHGLDRIYPHQHTMWARKMIAEGAIVTENISGTKPDRENFPRRNRIIAGLCDAVVVVEASTSGGALITADIANSYNRDVFAVPGRLNDPQSEGCNHLIKTNRAALIQSAKDICYVMGWDQITPKKQTIQTSLFIELNDEEKRLVGVLGNRQQLSIDEICSEMRIPNSKASSLLLCLELKGVVKCRPGKSYS